MRTRFRHRTSKKAAKPPPWNVTLATRMAPILLEISRHTVEYHITEAMKVLNVNSRIAAAVVASNFGLLD
ncbi:LuxR C-terminal-related transcriptional regulator [Burkholderia cepacia]|uniref:LuxR C-terminal-related transcriptional regulator n=1 Tax=Burkholderia cepacia TaxID=292 RepID=UPI002ED43CEF